MIRDAGVDHRHARSGLLHDPDSDGPHQMLVRAQEHAGIEFGPRVEHAELQALLDIVPPNAKPSRDPADGT